MLVSVVIPNYNHAPYLDQRIQSVLAQTYPHFEVILLDDCSTDNSAEILAKYNGHEKVSQVVLNEQNSGTTFKQWAKGIELARGEWIWIAESDDWCEPTLLQTLVEGVEPSTSLAFCQSVVVRANDVLWTSQPQKLGFSHAGGTFVQERMLSGNAIFNASMCIFRKANYYAIGPMFTTFRFCGDWVFWIALAQHGNVYESGCFLNYFRKHGADVSGPAYLNGLAHYEYIRLLNYLLAEHIITQDKKEELLLYKFREFLADNRLDPQRREEIAELFRIELGNAWLSQSAYTLLGKRIFLHMLRQTALSRFTT
jgi:glycosyltransferase involved in cell wall biosynthesis